MTDNRSTLAYGSWPSAVSAKDLVAGVVSLSGLTSDGERLYWLEGRPEEGGRSVLMVAEADGPRELTPAPYNVRSRVHEYGGGAFRVANGLAYFVNFADQNLYRVDLDGEISQITDSGPELRFADFVIDAVGTQLISVVERHHADREPDNLIAAIDIASGAMTVLAEGHDFYAAPRLSPDGTRLAFIAWDHPNMPWDGTILQLAELIDQAGAPTLTNLHTVAGGAQESVQQPYWLNNESLLYISDANGYWNLYRFDESGIFCVLEEGADYAGPPWTFDSRTFTAVDGEHVIIRRQAAAGEDLVLVNTMSTLATPLSESGGARLSYGSPAVLDGNLFFIASFSNRLPAIEKMPLSGGEPTPLVSAGELAIPPEEIAPGQPLTFPTRDGLEAHAYFYAPKNSACSGSVEARPPLLVLSHGGPTAATSASLNLAIQYYTNRGWAVLDVNYRGSSGYGRSYRSALNGNWGLLDVTDCEDGVRHLVRQRQVRLPD